MKEALVGFGVSMMLLFVVMLAARQLVLDYETNQKIMQVSLVLLVGVFPLVSYVVRRMK